MVMMMTMMMMNMNEDDDSDNRLRFFNAHKRTLFGKGNYKETDPLLPINNYAWSKLGGETSVQLYKNSLIVRVCMTERPFVHKVAFANVKTSFAYHDEVVKILFKVLNTDSSEDILPSSKEISLKLVFIYFTLTLICAAAYKIFGMNFFDSLTHSMTTIATGGFSNYNESIGYFNNVKIEITAILFIILGSIPFIAYIKFLNGNRKVFLNDTQVITFLKVTIISILIISIYLFFKLESFGVTDLRSVIFNSISILTGTGYVTGQFDQWGSFSLFYFLILMFIGGCAGSTTCGIKIFRVQILYKFVMTQLKKIIYRRGIFVIKYENNNVNDKFLASIISFIYLYILIFFFITALLSITGLDFITSISAAATSISNVGPGLGSVIGSNGNFSTLPDASKWILSAGMILGRLELFAILVLFLPSFWKK